MAVIKANDEVRVVLADVLNRVTVTASRRPEALGETASSVLVLSSSDLKTTAGLGLDDALRQVPGFTLLRRTPSRGANPTTQGATVRGLAGSGASRAPPVLISRPMSRFSTRSRQFSLCCE